MKSASSKSIRYVVGTFSDEKQKGEPAYVIWKKTQVCLRANLIKKQSGHVWMRVVVGDCTNEVCTTSMSELKSALSCFTEQPLVDYLLKK